MKIWLANPKRCTTKMLQIYTRKVLALNSKVIIISGIIYYQITLLRINYLQNFCQTHSNTKLTRLRCLNPLDCLQLCNDHNHLKEFATGCKYPKSGFADIRSSLTNLKPVTLVYSSERTHSQEQD